MICTSRCALSVIEFENKVIDTTRWRKTDHIGLPCSESITGLWNAMFSKMTGISSYSTFINSASAFQTSTNKPVAGKTIRLSTMWPTRKWKGASFVMSRIFFICKQWCGYFQNSNETSTQVWELSCSQTNRGGYAYLSHIRKMLLLILWTSPRLGHSIFDGDPSLPDCTTWAYQPEPDTLSGVKCFVSWHQLLKHTVFRFRNKERQILTLLSFSSMEPQCMSATIFSLLTVMKNHRFYPEQKRWDQTKTHKFTHFKSGMRAYFYNDCIFRDVLNSIVEEDRIFHIICNIFCRTIATELAVPFTLRHRRRNPFRRTSLWLWNDLNSQKHVLAVKQQLYIL